MQSSTTVQMNARIESSLKEAGDRVLGLLGYTPTQAIRGLWQYVIDHRDDPAAVARVICGRDAAEQQDDQTRMRLLALAQGQELCSALGPLSPAIANASYEELRDAMYDERYAQSL